MKTKQTSSKRILSMLLTLAMVLTLLPTTAFALTTLNEVKITGLDTPVVGATPDTTCNVSEGMDIVSVEWLEKGGSRGGFVKMTTDTFQAGNTYGCNFVLVSQGDCLWPIGEDTGTDYAKYTGTIYINGEKCNNSSYVQLSKDELQFMSTPVELKGNKVISEVKVTGLDKPVVGERPDTTCNVSEGVEKTFLYWQEAGSTGGFEDFSNTATFQAGKKYRCVLHLKPQTSYVWKLGASFDTYGRQFDGTAYIFDEMRFVENSYIMTATNEMHLISSAFELKAAAEPSGPSTETSKPVITKQPQDVNDSNANENFSFTVAASGEGLHYQWWREKDGKQEKVGSDSPTYSEIRLVTNIQSNTSYWCVVSNAAGEVTSQKAKLIISMYIFPFNDVPTSTWYYESVKGANQMGLIDGKTATLYKPNDNMTFAEATKLAACMHQLYTDGEVTLKNGSPWYSTYYDYCRTNGIIPAFSNVNELGYDDLLSYANNRITRQRYALLFSRALPDEALAEKNLIPDDSIPNEGMIGGVYKEAVYKLYRAGIINGVDAKGTFNPDSYIRRSEVAAILIRMMDPSTRVSAPSKLGE